VVSPTARSLYPRKDPGILCRRLGGPQERSREEWKISPPPGFDPRTVQSPDQAVACCYTDFAIPTLILSQLNPANALQFYSFKIHYNVMSSSSAFKLVVEVRAVWWKEKLFENYWFLNNSILRMLIPLLKLL
jgi:hypothetical protein